MLTQDQINSYRSQYGINNTPTASPSASTPPPSDWNTRFQNLQNIAKTSQDAKNVPDPNQDPLGHIQASVQTQQAPQGKIGGFFSDVGGFLKGAYKGAASTVSNLESGSQNVLDFIAKPISESITGKPYQTTPNMNQTFQGTTALTPTTTAEKIGKGTEQVAEFFIPGGAEETAANATGKVLEKTPNIVKTIGKLGAKSATSAASMATITGIQGGSAKEVGQAALLGGILPGAGKVLEGTGKGVAEAVIPTSAREAKLLQSYKASAPFWDRVSSALGGEGKVAPVTAATTAFNKGLVGTESMIGIQAKRASNSLWKDLISPALEKDSSKVDLQKFFSDAKTQIIKDNPELSRQKALTTALQALKDDYKGVSKVPLADLQKFKEGWAQFVPQKAYKGGDIAGAFNDVKNYLAGNARNLIYNKLGPEVKQAYFDYGNLKGLQELGQKAMTGSGLKGGAGKFLHSVWEMATVPVGTIGGQTIYKVGKGIEMFGKPGAKLVKDLIPQPSTTP